ncbi:hypothetical protein Tco_1569034 [Tanacetum coccineum]
MQTCYEVPDDVINRQLRVAIVTWSQLFQTASPQSELESLMCLHARLPSYLVSSKIEPKSSVFPPNAFQVLTNCLDKMEGLKKMVIMLMFFLAWMQGSMEEGKMQINDEKHGKWTKITKKYRLPQDFTARKFIMEDIAAESSLRHKEEKGYVKGDEKKRLDHLKQDLRMLVIKIFSERKKVFRERKKCEKIHAKSSDGGGEGVVVMKVSAVVGGCSVAYGGDGVDDDVDGVTVVMMKVVVMAMMVVGCRGTAASRDGGERWCE